MVPHLGDKRETAWSMTEALGGLRSAGRARRRGMSFNDSVVVSVAAYPDAHRSVSAGLLEVKGRVRRILLQKGILRIGELSNGLWQSLVAVPEGR